MAERHDAHGYWLDEAGAYEPAAPLGGAVEADVLVAGGGYTGMWTAWHLKRLRPEARVVLCEAATCGEGPSGRNGGFVNGLWFSLPALRERFGNGPAIEVARAAQRSVTEIGQFCRDEGVDAWFTQAGYLQVATAPAWDRAWERTARTCAELGEPGACVPVSAEEVRRRCASPIFRGGAFYPGAATVQPARLGRALAVRLREVGVEVYERTPVGQVECRDGGIAAAAGAGRVRAKAAVIATGSALGSRPGMRLRLTVTSSHIALTEPVPDLLSEIGWTGGECITDSRAMVHYFRTTPDGRIAFGWGGGRVVLGARTHGRAERDPDVIAELERHMLRFFPGLAGRRVEQAWGGPIDVSPSHLPVIAKIGPGIHCAFGYTGHGVGPSHLLGRSLASLSFGLDDEFSRLALVNPPAIRVPPEPLRYLGGSLIRRAILRQEAAMERGDEPGPVTSAVAGIPAKIGIHIGRG